MSQQLFPTPARDTKTDALFIIGSILTMVLWLVFDFGYFLALLWGVGIAHLICYRLPPRPPEKFLPWLNREMMPFALLYGFGYKLPQLLSVWLETWAAYALPLSVLLIGMQVHASYNRHQHGLARAGQRRFLAP